MSALPGAAANTIAPLLLGDDIAGRVVGVHPSCVYVVSGSELVALETADGLGLPCAVRVGVDRSAAPFTAAGLRVGDAASLGNGGVVAGRLSVRVARWWQPRRPRPAGPIQAGAPLPTVRGVRRYDAARVSVLAAMLPGLLAPTDLPVPVDASVSELLGRGSGLTPAGDDVLAGALVALYGDPAHQALAREVTQLAGSRTTALSAALLRCASEGMALPAVLDVVDALGGHGADDAFVTAVRRLLAVGSSSGGALAAGVLRGASTTAAARAAA